MTGRHRGRATLRWWLVAAVVAAAVGRGYAGRHRLEAAALGTRTTISAPAVVEAAARPTVAAPAAPPTAQLAVVPVASSPDPLVDTVPHPVVKLFPLPVVDGATVPVVGEDAVFAEVDREREAQATTELAAAVDVRAQGRAAYHGRHSA